jgi:hypothetical protein
MTRQQRQMLELAARTDDGNPWMFIGIKRRAGGSLSRMFNKMKADGLFDEMNCITEKGRKALEAG